MHRKPTHTDLYLHVARFHHPTHKWAVLATLIQRARVVSDAHNLASELNYLRIVLIQNGYPQGEIE